MEKRKKTVYGYVKKCIWLLTMLALVGGVVLGNYAKEVNAAYSFAVSSATQDGTVTIVPIKGTAVNGYYVPKGYQVTYTITKESWKAFHTEGYFYMGNDLRLAGGCSFGYAPSGTVWEQGAIQLGAMPDGTFIANGEATSGTVSCTFQVAKLSDLPTYIAFGYAPASGEYRHISEDYGELYHIWHYQKLSGTSVSGMSQVDTTGPTLTSSTAPVGEYVEKGGKIWSKEVSIDITAKDTQSGAGGIWFYQNNSLQKEYANTNQSAASMSASHMVTANGTFQVQAYDRLKNTSQKITVVVDGVDNDAPIIQNITADDGQHCIENKITVVTEDAGAGLAEAAYSWNNGQWTDSSEYIAKENGVYTVKIRDALGNEAGSSVEIKNIDNKPPVIESVREEVGDDGKVRIAVTASDYEGGCGLHEKAYSFDGGKTWQAESKIVVDKNGIYQIWVRDALGLYSIADTEVVSIKEIIAPDNPITPDIPKTPDVPKTPDIPNMPDVPKIVDDDIEDTEPETDSDSSEVEFVSRPFIPRVKENSVLVENEELMSEPDSEAVESILKPQPIQSDSGQKVVLAVLLGILIAGILGLGLYLLLFGLHYSCILYGVNDKQERERICRLPVRRLDTEWQVKVPDDKLGEQGTGRYVLVFHPAFIKEESATAVIIVIDNRSIRENLAEEIVFRI